MSVLLAVGTVAAMAAVFAAGYWHGRAVGMERGQVDAWRRRSELDKRRAER